MKRRALAPIGALGLGALAVAWLDLGSAAPPPPDDPLSAYRSAWGGDPGMHGTASGPTLDSDSHARRTRPGASRPAYTLRPATIEQLGRQAGWIKFLETWCHLPPMLDATTRFRELRQTLAQTTNPVIRQNLIFLVALGLPTQLTRSWLQELSRAGDADDAEDALCALAFSGESLAHAAFLELANSPSAADVHRLRDDEKDLEALGQEGTVAARAILRSYHCIEASDRSPYFHLTAFLASHEWGSTTSYGQHLGWTERIPRSLDATEALYVAFLARYPGHPVSDDLARRLGRLRAQADEPVEAVRWFSRAATLPDQDEAYDAAQLMAAYCEMVLTPEQVLALAHDEGMRSPNRSYFQYVWLRRLAAERGFESALRAWESLALGEPGSELAVAWGQRLAIPPPKGLESGVAPLAADDPLREVTPHEAKWPASRSTSMTYPRPYGLFTGYSYPEEKYRLEPWPEVVLLDRDRLVQQARAWLTLAELERRTAVAHDAARADLLYKQAALYYHDRNVLFPAYGEHTITFRRVLAGDEWTWDDDKKRERKRAGRRFETSSFSYLHAIALFEQIENEHPGYAALDKVFFSLGLSWRQLSDYRPYYSWSPELEERWLERQEPCLREIVRNFERCEARFPESPLSPDARLAAAYWRRTQPALFRD